jgi:chemotaxis family two-component system response regulator PixG
MQNRTEQRLTCNRIFRHLVFYKLQKFTGKIQVSTHQGETWNFYFLLGHLTWASGGNYPLRRWRRQFYAATGQVPQLDHIDWGVESWDCTELRVLTESNTISGEQVQSIVQGTLEEVLFDVVQAFEAPIYRCLSASKSLVNVSQLTGIGDGMELEIQEGVTPDRYYRLPYSFFPDVKLLQEKIRENWKKWVEMGLARVSPNQAPLLLEPEKLQSRVSPKVYQNMAKGLQGQTSLRDLAFKFKKQGNFFTLASAIAPYYEDQLVTFNKVQDLAVRNHSQGTYSSTLLTTSEPKQKEPLFLAVDSSRKNQSLLSAIAQKQGYKFEVISDGISALQKITQNPLWQVKMIFVSYEMAILKPTEFCTILRRIEIVETVPIVFYTKRPLPNREAQELLQAGASELMNKNSLTPSNVNAILKKYQKQSQRQAKQKRTQGTHSDSNLTFLQRGFSMTMS